MIMQRLQFVLFFRGCRADQQPSHCSMWGTAAPPLRLPFPPWHCNAAVFPAAFPRLPAGPSGALQPRSRCSRLCGARAVSSGNGCWWGEDPEGANSGIMGVRHLCIGFLMLLFWKNLTWGASFTQGIYITLWHSRRSVSHKCCLVQ